MAAMLREAAPLPAHTRVADTFDHKKSSQLRYNVNLPGPSQVRVHQHPNMGQGEIDWNLFFQTLGKVGFNGVVSASVFAREERAKDSSRFMRGEMQRYIAR